MCSSYHWFFSCLILQLTGRECNSQKIGESRRASWGGRGEGGEESPKLKVETGKGARSDLSNIIVCLYSRRLQAVTPLPVPTPPEVFQQQQIFFLHNVEQLFKIVFLFYPDHDSFFMDRLNQLTNMFQSYWLSWCTTSVQLCTPTVVRPPPTPINSKIIWCFL